jgi:hypothetical protein
MVFAIYNKKNYKTWPVNLYGIDKEEYFLLKTKEEVEAWLKDNNKIYYKDIEKQNPIKELLKSQIFTIIGPIQLESPQSTPLEQIYSLSEAASKWYLSDGGTVRQAALRGKFKENEARKSDGTWFVTHHGMLRVFGPIEDEDDHLERLIVNEVSFDMKNIK